MKYLTKVWKNMTAAEKERYKQISELDRGRFDAERRYIKQTGVGTSQTDQFQIQLLTQT
jgi:hypothetical protein